MTTTTDSAASASIDVAARELRLPTIRSHASRSADEVKRAKATYLGFLADKPSRLRSMTALNDAECDASTKPDSRA